MERYCIGHIYEKKDFQSPDPEGYLDIDHGNLMNRLIPPAEQVEWEIPLGPPNIKDLRCVIGSTPEEYDEVSSFKNTLCSVGCEMDILNDLYLLLMAADDSEELLLFQQSQDSNITIKTSRGEIYDPKDEIDALNDCMKNTIRNRKKKKENLIFSINGLSRSSDTKIRPLGKGVKRLWLYSRTFRSLFNIPENDLTKYRTEIIRDSINGVLINIKEGTKKSMGFDKYVKYSIDDCIILEKLLGLDTNLNLHLYILPQVSDLPYEDIEPLIDILIECKGLYSRRLFMLDFGYYLSKAEHLSTLHKAEWIKMSVKKLEKAIRAFNKCYYKAVDIYMKNYTEIYSYEKAKEIVLRKRERLASFSCPFVTQSDFYTKIHTDYLYEHIVDQILRMKDDKTQAAKSLEIWDMTKNRMYLWSEREFYHRYQPAEYPEPVEQSNRIQSHIIEKSREKYDRKM